MYINPKKGKFLTGLYCLILMFRLSVVAQKTLQRKEERKSKHCNHCWFVRDSCICSLIKPVKFSNNLRFLIFMHYQGNITINHCCREMESLQYCQVTVTGCSAIFSIVCLRQNRGRSIVKTRDSKRPFTHLYPVSFYRVYSRILPIISC